MNAGLVPSQYPAFHRSTNGRVAKSSRRALGNPGWRPTSGVAPSWHVPVAQWGLGTPCRSRVGSYPGWWFAHPNSDCSHRAESCRVVWAIRGRWRRWRSRNRGRGGTSVVPVVLLHLRWADPNPAIQARLQWVRLIRLCSGWCSTTPTTNTLPATRWSGLRPSRRTCAWSWAWSRKLAAVRREFKPAATSHDLAGRSSLSDIPAALEWQCSRHTVATDWRISPGVLAPLDSPGVPPRCRLLVVPSC